MVMNKNKNTSSNPSNHLIKGFKPLVGENPKILILGTAPGQESLATKEYYSSRTNSFWKIVGIIYNQGNEFQDYGQKVEVLKANHVAVWDVIHSCIRDGSSDKNIKNPEFNNLEQFLQKYPSISLVVFNGVKSKKFFDKCTKTDKNCKVLPSTSRARAIPFAKKVDEWRQALSSVDNMEECHNGCSFYGDSLLEWLKEVCIVETEEEVYYDAEQADEEVVDLFIKNLKFLLSNDDEELLEKLSFKTAKDFIAFLDDDDNDLALAYYMICAAYCTKYGIAIDDDTELYVEDQLYYFNDSRDVHYERSTDIDLG